MEKCAHMSKRTMRPFTRHVVIKHDSDDNDNFRSYTAKKKYLTKTIQLSWSMAPWMFVSAIWTRQLRFHNSMKCCRVARFEFPAMWNTGEFGHDGVLVFVKQETHRPPICWGSHDFGWWKLGPLLGIGIISILAILPVSKVQKQNPLAWRDARGIWLVLCDGDCGKWQGWVLVAKWLGGFEKLFVLVDSIFCGSGCLHAPDVTKLNETIVWWCTLKLKSLSCVGSSALSH